MAHEFGHAWTTYWFRARQGSSWLPCTTARWSTADGSMKLAEDSRLNTSYTWSVDELMADDHRLLFGSPAAIAAARHLNSYIVDPRDQADLRDWYLATWVG